MNGAAIRVERLCIGYHERPVFDGFDVTVERGETVAILGASGCGKSTLLRCIAGLVTPSGGTLAVAGEIGFVFQEPRLMPWLTVEKNVAFAARDARERNRVASALELAQLASAAQRLPKELSGGMAQRAAFARSLVRDPQILLLDEPLSALDALLRIDLQTAIARIIAQTRCSALLVTHDVDEALFLADRVVVLGGTPARTVLQMPIAPHLRRARDADLANERMRLLGALGVEAGSSSAVAL